MMMPAANTPTDSVGPTHRTIIVPISREAPIVGYTTYIASSQIAFVSQSATGKCHDQRQSKAEAAADASDRLPRRLKSKPSNAGKAGEGIRGDSFAPKRIRKMFAPNPNRRLRETIFLGAVVIGAAALGAVVLYAATTWLWLVAHQGLH